MPITAGVHLRQLPVWMPAGEMLTAIRPVKRAPVPLSSRWPLPRFTNGLIAIRQHKEDVPVDVAFCYSLLLDDIRLDALQHENL